MRVSCIKENKIENMILPEKVEGNYWITNTDKNGIKRNLISIEAQDGKWKLLSNKEAYFMDSGITEISITLEEGKFYTVYSGLDKKETLIYCSKVIGNYICFQIEDKLDEGISIGKAINNFIVYGALDDIVCTIKRTDGKLCILVESSNNAVYVNNIRIDNNKELKLGDIIFIYGLKIIITNMQNEKTTIGILVNKDDLKGVQINALPTKKNEPSNELFTESSEEVDMPMYDESEYFHQMPRVYQKKVTFKMNIDSPPSKNNAKESPLLLTIGPMLTMSLTSVVMAYVSISRVMDGQTTVRNVAPTIVISAAMMGSVLIWPSISKWYQKKEKEKDELLRRQKYNAYIQNKREQIIKEKEKQSSILRNNSIGTKEAYDTIVNRYTSLWQRKIADGDYLEINLGRGTFPMDIDISYPEEHFSMEEDDLKDIVLSLGREPKNLQDVPILLSLREKFITGFIGNDDLSTYFKGILLQILANHGYDELKIIVLTDEENEYKWSFLKQIPHLFADNSTLRFFATNNNEYKTVCAYLNKVWETHLSEKKDKKLDKTYLIVTDVFKRIRSYDVIENILESDSYHGFSIAILDKKMTSLPPQCETFVTLMKEQGELKYSQNINESIPFAVKIDDVYDYDLCTKILANIPIDLNIKDESQLAKKIGFLEMYDVGKIEQLNILARWRQNNPILSIQAPVGVGKNGEIIAIDFHEKYHGPHGLIAGMTGSGKSEFIITFIMSLAINYHPYEVQFILIDYKGGGLAGALENKITGVKLPHLVGTITNLDANEIKRGLASIDSELKKRQELFNKARELSKESTIDIYKYQKMYRDNVVTEPISHLFIVTDEFAELKSQQPEFMEQLITTARIGRSLGVHLILATQKPSGVVDPQIWSNTRFRVCMRVQDKSDSNEVIKCPDAAYLKDTGRFYFQVGYNEVFTLGQAAYTGGKYIPQEKKIKSLDSSIDFIDNLGNIYEKIDTKDILAEKSVPNLGGELQNFVTYLSDTAKHQGIKCPPLWLERIPEDIRIEDLAQKYNYISEQYILEPLIGEYDIPSKQRQSLFTIPFTREGNVLVYGANGSGKENLISTLLYSSSLYYSPKEVNYYVVDLGSGSLKAFAGYPIVGDIVRPEDGEKLENLYKMITKLIEQRKALFQSYNGDYYTYCKNTGSVLPNVVIIINNFESYQEIYSKYEDILLSLSRESPRYGIYFMITVNTPTGIRLKFRQNFSQILALRQNNDDDYVSILGRINKTYPANMFGRGIFKTDDVYEFQTASIAPKDDINTVIRKKKEEFKTAYSTLAPSIPVLPQTVGVNEIITELGKSDELIIGIGKDSLDVVKFNFLKNYITLITATDLHTTNKFLNPLLNQIIVHKDASLIVINPEDYEINAEYTKYYQYIDKYFDRAFKSIASFITTQYRAYLDAGYDKALFKDKKKIYCVIISPTSFKSRLDDENKNQFAEVFNKGRELGIINFLFVDAVDQIKKIELEPWYKNNVNSTSGIWLGNNITDQYTIKYSQKTQEMKDKIPENFCFVIKHGKTEYVKFVEKFEIK